MLFAGLQRQDESAPAVLIHCCAGEPAGNPPQIFFARRENPQIRAAVVKRVAEALAFAHDEIRSAFARGLEKAQACGVGKSGNEHRALLVGRVGQRPDIFDAAEEIRALHDDRRRFLVQRG